MVDEDGRGIDYLVISLEQRQEQIFLKERTVKWGKNVGSVSLRITEFSRVGGPRRGGEREVAREKGVAVARRKEHDNPQITWQEAITCR